MIEYTDLLIFSAGFLIVSLAAKEIGIVFSKIHFPLISGFLFTGIIVGPYVLNLVPIEAIPHLSFIDKTALAFIAFSAGGEFYIKDFRDRVKSMVWITAGLVSLTFTLGSLAFALMGDYIPFMVDMSFTQRVAIGILAGSILVARSPSSAIAIVRELHASGPFTRTALGVTVLIDVAVIILFTINSEMANVMLTGRDINLLVHIKLVVELAAALVIGWIISYILSKLISTNWPFQIKIAGILFIGFHIFYLSELLVEYTHTRYNFDFHIEPLLTAMAASFWIVNKTVHRHEWLKLIHIIGPVIYIAFFTLTGISLSLDILLMTWPITLILFGVRLGAIFLGSFTGGVIAGDSMEQNRIQWMAYIPQAGVGLGLAKNVAGAYPDFGASFATVIISVIVLNQIVGPPFFKWAIKHMGEAHVRGKTDPLMDHSALIFGIDNQGVALAKQLEQHGWKVRLMCTQKEQPKSLHTDLMDVVVTAASDLEGLEEVGAKKADAVILLLSDEENLALCRTFYEVYGTETIVVRMADHEYYDLFHELGALIVEPRTAIVSLLDQFVRSPSAASLLMGETDQEIVDVEVRNPYFQGMAVRDLPLPEDVLILSMHREGRDFISHGYNHLHKGDKLTMMGSKTSLEDIILNFEENSAG